MGWGRCVVGVSLLGTLGLACSDDEARDAGMPWESSSSGSTAAATDPSTTDATGQTAGSTTSAGSGTSATSAATSTTTTTGDPSTGDDSAGSSGGDGLVPPAGQSSGGSGGGGANGETRMTGSGVSYNILAPSSGAALPLMIVYSGTEGVTQMTANLASIGGPTGNTGTVFAVLDGPTYFGNGDAGADVLDEVRSQYDIDNDRTYLLSESAGTSAGLELGLQLRQSYFAAYWANDVNTQAVPLMSATELGFEPFGNAGPGGDFPDANAIVAGMMQAGYRTPAPAPYDGAGADTHGSPEQFTAALSWFPGKTRQ